MPTRAPDAPSYGGPYMPVLRDRDAVAFLTGYICLVFAMPAPLQVGALGSAGSPANLLAIGAFLWWAWFHLQRPDHFRPGRQPVRRAALTWLFVVLVVYAHAMTQPVVVEELSPADSGVLRVVGACGLLLVACDGIASLKRLRDVERRLVLGAGAIALLGLLQYALKQPLVDRISIPGLTEGASGWVLAERSGLARPSGTSTHPIEYGAVLTLLMPLVITFALRSPVRAWLYRTIMVMVCFAVFLSISRSAMICALVAVLLLARTWSWATRLWSLGFALVVFAAVYLTTPGVLGTIGRLFTGISGDDSVASRTGSYPVAWQFVERRPWFGRGYGTFLPEYWILDNQYLLVVIETGIIGLAVLLVLLGVGVHCARAGHRALPEGFDRDLAWALIASIASGTAGLAFFDSFSYPQSTGTLFLTLGLAGALWRLTRTPDDSVGDAAESAVRTPASEGALSAR